MMCNIGMPPISIIGLGLRCVSSEILVPIPPASITAFIVFFLESELGSSLRASFYFACSMLDRFLAS